MNIYLWSTELSWEFLQSTGLNAVYKWSETVYESSPTPPAPIVFEYSYDFRNKSVSQIKSDWWVIKQWESWCTINSSWLQRPTKWQWDANKLKVYYPLTLTWATYIKFEYVTSLTAQSWANGWWMWIWDSSVWEINLYSSIIWTTASWYTNAWSISTRSWSNKYSWAASTWTWTMTVECDIANKIAYLTKTWQSRISLSITDSDISYILWSNSFMQNIWHDIGSQYTQSVYIKIEY